MAIGKVTVLFQFCLFFPFNEKSFRWNFQETYNTFYTKPKSKGFIQFTCSFSLDETDTKEVNTLNRSGQSCIFFLKILFCYSICCANMPEIKCVRCIVPISNTQSFYALDFWMASKFLLAQILIFINIFVFKNIFRR